MKWAQPKFKNQRFGFEISMFIYMKPSLTMMQSKEEQAAYQYQIMDKACRIPEYH